MQTLQFEQMQVVLQTAQNHTSIETPLRAEHLITAHFNLAILTDNTASNVTVNALRTETGVTDPSPSTSASEQETACKTPYRNSSAAKWNKTVQPTGVVFPTCRGEPGLVRGIPAGYESDNSWDCHSNTGKQNCSHNSYITPLVAYTSWRGCPNRGQGQNYGPGGNIAVRGGNLPHSQPWHNQPYGRQTRSQQALWV